MAGKKKKKGKSIKKLWQNYSYNLVGSHPFGQGKTSKSTWFKNEQKFTGDFCGYLFIIRDLEPITQNEAPLEP